MPTPFGNFVSGSRGADSAVPSVPSHWPNAAVVSSSGSGGGGAAFCYEFASQGASIAPRAWASLSATQRAWRQESARQASGTNCFSTSPCAAFSRHTLLSALTRPARCPSRSRERDSQRACVGARSLRPARPAKERNFTAARQAGRPASRRAHSPLYRPSTPTTLSAAVSHFYPVRAGTGRAWTGAANHARRRPHMPSKNRHRLPRAWAAWSITALCPAIAVRRPDRALRM